MSTATRVSSSALRYLQGDELARAQHLGDVVCDLDRLLVSRALIQGVSGSGKSSALRALLEQTHGKVQHLVIDRDGEFSTLREKFPYLLVGPDGDVPAHPKTAAVLTRRLVEWGASAIVDLSEMKLPDQRAWVRRSFEELLNLPRSLWRPLLVPLDEAHLFAPERSEGDAESRDAVINVATLGRKRGFCLIAATQRLSKLHKDCAAELQNKIIGYTDDVDMRRAVEQLGMSPGDRELLRGLEPGWFYTKGPAFSREPRRSYIGETATSAPARGQARPLAAPPPKAIQKLAEQLADLPKQAEDEARSIEELQRRVADRDRKIRELERAKPKAPEAKVEIRTKEVPVDRPVPFVPPEYSEVVSAAEALNRAIGSFAKAAKKAPPRPTGIGLTHAPEKGRGTAWIKAPTEDLRERARFAPPTPRGGDAEVDDRTTQRFARPASAEGATDALSKGQRVVLKAIAQHADGVTRDQLTVLTGYRRSSRDTYLQQLKQYGCIEFEGEAILATGNGVAALGGDYEPLPTGDALREHWLRELSGGEKRILEELIAYYPNAIERSDLDEPTGYKRSSRDTYLQKLASRKLVQVVGRSQVKASALLFDRAKA